MQEADSSAELSPTLCARALTNLHITNSGHAKLCCYTEELIADASGRPLALAHHSVDAIWNAAGARAAREAMARGQRLSMCRYCHDEEALTGASPRTQANAWMAQIEPGRPFLLRELAAQAASADFASPKPIFLLIEVGNLCNLACRMCSSDASSKIQDDPTHSQWSPPQVPPALVRIGGSSGDFQEVQWFERPEILYGDLLGEPERLRNIFLIGGEPLISPQFEGILDHFIDAGVAPSLLIGFNTNATVVRPRVLERLTRFKVVQAFASLDGHGESYEYIRYPARWKTVAASMDALSALPNVRIGVSPVLQAYNALQIVDLLRYCDEHAWTFSISPLTGPEHISLRVLPPEARRVAVERLRHYSTSCRPENLPTVLAAIDRLEVLGDAFDVNDPNVHVFNTFTNDLDITRGQSFERTHAELFEYLRRAGYSWKPDLQFAPKFSGATR
jgi:MoaA/NifB/PqqE/SkfB family radical SAM enzyme